jgi:histidinol dehydrogenase
MDTTEKFEKYVKHIMSQTNYSEDVAREKLKECNNDFMKVLKDYMGIPEKKINTQIKSVNQEIYKQIRHSLDQTMKEYRDKNPIDIDQVKTNLQESEEREKDKR